MGPTNLRTAIEGAVTQADEVARLREENMNLVELLETVQWGFNHCRCPICAGWMMGPYGETDFKHTPECPIGVAVAKGRP